VQNSREFGSKDLLASISTTTLLLSLVEGMY
jgi:hypothetical protein